MSEEQKIQFKIFRYKEGDAEPHYDTFTTTVGTKTTVLDALYKIQRGDDDTIAMRHSCLHASCGTCGMKVNGKEVLSCVTNVLELGTPTVVVEPLDNAPLISDLVVDMTEFYEVYDEADRPYIRESEFLPDSAVAEGIETHTRMENCIECAICVSACPVEATSGKYLGPAAMAAGYRVVEEPRGQDVPSILDWVDQEHGCWRCHAVFECTEVCPSDVEPGEKIMGLRRELTKKKIRRLFGLR